MEARRIVCEDAILAQINLKGRGRYPHTVLYVGELSPPGIPFQTDIPAILLADSQLLCEARSIAIWRGTGYRLAKQLTSTGGA